MLYYIFIISLLSFSAFFDKTKYQDVLYFTLSFLLILFSGFRVGGTGPADYDAYLRLYSMVSDWEAVIDPKIHAEIGFRLLSYVGNLIGFDGQFIILAMAFFAALPVIIIIRKYSCYPNFSLLIWIPYFLTMNMHSSRVSVSAAFCLCVFIFIFFRRYLFAFFFLLLAISFHSSSLALLALLLIRFRISFLIYLAFIVFIFVSFINPFGFLSVLFSLVGAERIGLLVESYIASSDYGYPMPLYDPRILLNLAILLLIFNIRRTLSDSFHIYIFKLTIVGAILLFLFSSVTIIAWRVSYLFLLCSVISLPVLSQYYNCRFFATFSIKRLATLFVGLTFLLYSLPLVFMSLPYQSYLKVIL